MTQLDRCTSCRAVLAAGEIGRQGCLCCQQSADRRLRDLSGPAGLYAAVTDAVAPFRAAAGPRVSGSRGAGLPPGCDLRALDLTALTGGVRDVLRQWAEDWHRLMGRSLPAGLGFDELCGTLRFHLDWAAREHPAWADFAQELGRQTERCRKVAGRQEALRRRVVGACPILLADGTECGGDLEYRQEDVTTRCRACHTVAPVDWQAVRAAVAQSA